MIEEELKMPRDVANFSVKEENATPNFRHIMLDLETLSSREDAVILSIGAVRFDLDALLVARDDDGFYQTVSGKDCLERGLRIDYDTILWWMKQSPESREVFEGVSVPLREALGLFQSYVKKIPDSTIWGNGSTFDNMILRNAFRVCCMEYPVTYRDDLCYRTIKKMLGLISEDKRQGIKHNAFDDAVSQANALVGIFRGLRTKELRND